MDRGFLFGDGVYEVLPVYGGQLFRLMQHLERLDQSLAGIHLDNPLSRSTWRELLEELVRRNGGGDQAVYLQVTRGVAPKRDHAFPPGVAATVFVMSNPLAPLPREQREQGVRAATLEDIRWRWCHIKAIALLPNVLLRQQALDAGADEAILIRDGEVTEGAASNVFIVRAGVLATPPKGPFLLPGITRDLILELAAANGIPHQEVSITEAALRQADEVWLTSSTKEILPVTRLDDSPVGIGRPGPLWTRLYQVYQDYKQAVRTGIKD
jgi:D-alanine transaminase